MLALYLVGALAIFGLEASAVLNETSANLVCNLLKDGTLINSGNDCRNYYSCKKGLATLTSCPKGYYFSKDRQACVLPSEVVCNSNDANPCANIKDGTFISVANSCSDFWYCKNGVGSKGTCGDLNFNQEGQSCEYKNDFKCSVSTGDVTEENINLCAIVPSDRYFGSWQSCEMWQKCKSGQLIFGTCTDKLQFNVDTESCDYPDNVKCRQNTPTPGETPGIGSLDGQPCEYNKITVSDNQTCTGYYMCNNNKYTFGKCPNGLYYDPPTQTCVNRLNAINDCNRCEDTKLEFVNLFQEGCKGFGYCKGGQMVSKSACTNGNFNELAGACVTGSEKTYPVCEIPTAQTTTTADSTSSSTSTSSTTTISSTELTDKPGSSTTSSDPPKQPSESTEQPDSSTVSSEPTHSTESTEETNSPLPDTDPPKQPTESTEQTYSPLPDTDPTKQPTESTEQPDSTTYATKPESETDTTTTKKRRKTSTTEIPNVTEESSAGDQKEPEGGEPTDEKENSEEK